MKKWLLLIPSHILFAIGGFMAGIYYLPVMTASPAPTGAQVALAIKQTTRTGEFRRDLKDSDWLHWGEGKVSVGQDALVGQTQFAPGPDYQIYLSPEFIETEAAFNANKHRMAHIAPLKTFGNFVVSVPEGIDTEQFNTVIVWCETFGQFISAAQYAPAIPSSGHNP